MHGLEDVALEFAPPAHHRFTQPKIPGHRRNHRALSNADPVTSRQYYDVKRRRVPITGISLSTGSHAHFTKLQQHKPKPIQNKPWRCHRV